MSIISSLQLFYFPLVHNSLQTSRFVHAPLVMCPLKRVRENTARLQQGIYTYIYIYYAHVGTCRKQLRMVFLGCKTVKLMPLPPMLNLEVYEWLLHGGTCDSLGQRVIQNSMASPRDCGIRHSRSQAPKGARQSDSHDTSVFTSSMRPCVKSRNRGC